jgi:hypothetical protein
VNLSKGPNRNDFRAPLGPLGMAVHMHLSSV